MHRFAGLPPNLIPPWPQQKQKTASKSDGQVTVTMLPDFANLLILTAIKP